MHNKLPLKTWIQESKSLASKIGNFRKNDWMDYYDNLAPFFQNTVLIWNILLIIKAMHRCENWRESHASPVPLTFGDNLHGNPCSQDQNCKQWHGQQLAYITAHICDNSETYSSVVSLVESGSGEASPHSVTSALRNTSVTSGPLNTSASSLKSQKNGTLCWSIKCQCNYSPFRPHTSNKAACEIQVTLIIKCLLDPANFICFCLLRILLVVDIWDIWWHVHNRILLAGAMDNALDNFLMKASLLEI